ncbi:hypothetical protein [Maribacter sp. 2304DJ31-5]|uniref:hypothetical protein n=1 Tax=Maribacter sp. 2304DJ31-5 TaxID=3386273 RepID=UPI0039BC2FCF
MSLKDTFKSDLKNEQRLAVLLDAYYKKYLRYNDFERVNDVERQMQGIDLIFKNKSNGNIFSIDEKAQLDYPNRDLPTFAFEISYQKTGIPKKGWLFDTGKKTDFYALITNIQQDDDHKYTSCKITLVNRKKLISFLKIKNIDLTTLESYSSSDPNFHGKITLDELNPQTEGYLYFSTQNKAEKPVNLILKLDFLVAIGIAKRLV